MFNCLFQKKGKFFYCQKIKSFSRSPFGINIYVIKNLNFMEDEEKDFMKSFSSLKKYIYEKKIIDNIKVEIFFPEKEEYSPLYTAIAKDCIRHARHGSWSF